MGEEGDTWENCLICFGDLQTFPKEFIEVSVLQDLFQVLNQYLDWPRPPSLLSLTLEGQFGTCPFCDDCAPEIVKLLGLHENLGKISLQIQEVRDSLNERIADNFRQNSTSNDLEKHLEGLEPEFYQDPATLADPDVTYNDDPDLLDSFQENRLGYDGDHDVAQEVEVVYQMHLRPHDNKLHWFSSSVFAKKVEQVGKNQFVYNRKRSFEYFDVNSWKCLECGFVVTSSEKTAILDHYELKDTHCTGKPSKDSVKVYMFQNVLFDETVSGGFECRICPFVGKTRHEMKVHIAEEHDNKVQKTYWNRSKEVQNLLTESNQVTAGDDDSFSYLYGNIQYSGCSNEGVLVSSQITSDLLSSITNSKRRTRLTKILCLLDKFCKSKRQRTNTKISHYRIRPEWEQIVTNSLGSTDWKTKSKSQVICSLHFRSDDIIHLDNSRVKMGRLPTLYMGDPTPKKPQSIVVAFDPEQVQALIKYIHLDHDYSINMSTFTTAAGLCLPPQPCASDHAYARGESARSKQISVVPITLCSDDSGSGDNNSVVSPQSERNVGMRSTPEVEKSRIRKSDDPKILAMRKQLRAAKGRERRLRLSKELLLRNQRLEARPKEIAKFCQDQPMGSVLQSLINAKNRSNHVKHKAMRYDTSMRQLCSTLYSYSPKAYNFLRSSLALPHPRTAFAWQSGLACPQEATGQTESRTKSRCNPRRRKIARKSQSVSSASSPIDK